MNNKKNIISALKKNKYNKYKIENINNNIYNNKNNDDDNNNNSNKLHQNVATNLIATANKNNVNKINNLSNIAKTNTIQNNNAKTNTIQNNNASMINVNKNLIIDTKKENMTSNTLIDKNNNNVKKENITSNVLIDKNNNNVKKENITSNVLIDKNNNNVKKENITSNTLIDKNNNNVKIENITSNILINKNNDNNKIKNQTSNVLINENNDNNKIKNQISNVLEKKINNNNFIDKMNSMLIEYLNDIKKNDTDLNNIITMNNIFCNLRNLINMMQTYYNSFIIEHYNDDNSITNYITKTNINNLKHDALDESDNNQESINQLINLCEEQNKYKYKNIKKKNLCNMFNINYDMYKKSNNKILFDEKLFIQINSNILNNHDNLLKKYIEQYVLDGLICHENQLKFLFKSIKICMTKKNNIYVIHDNELIKINDFCKKYIYSIQNYNDIVKYDITKNNLKNSKILIMLYIDNEQFGIDILKKIINNNEIKKFAYIISISHEIIYDNILNMIYANLTNYAILKINAYNSHVQPNIIMFDFCKHFLIFDYILQIYNPNNDDMLNEFYDKFLNNINKCIDMFNFNKNIFTINLKKYESNAINDNNILKIIFENDILTKTYSSCNLLMCKKEVYNICLNKMEKYIKPLFLTIVRNDNVFKKTSIHEAFEKSIYYVSNEYKKINEFI
jgi:hypothetical protein